MGVLLCRAGQSTEEEMYNNEEASPAFSAFLELLGEQVLLKGFTKYAAQLDTKSESSQERLWLCSDSRIIRFVSQYRYERLDRGAVICKWSVSVWVALEITLATNTSYSGYMAFKRENMRNIDPLSSLPNDHAIKSQSITFISVHRLLLSVLLSIPLCS